MQPKIRYKKAKISERFFPLGGMHYPWSPWVLDSDAYNKEQAWLNKAWGMLAEEGLVTFEVEPERTQVAIRAMALALMYLDFCGKVFEVNTEEPPVADWADILGLTQEMLIAKSNHLCQKSYTIQDLEEEGEEFLYNMIVELSNYARDEVFDALVNNFGDINDFFMSLTEIHPYDNDNAHDAFAWFYEKMYPIDVPN
jgi:hypothetical protein